MITRIVRTTKLCSETKNSSYFNDDCRRMRGGTHLCGTFVRCTESLADWPRELNRASTVPKVAPNPQSLQSICFDCSRFGGERQVVDRCGAMWFRECIVVPAGGPVSAFQSFYCCRNPVPLFTVVRSCRLPFL